MKAVLVDAYDSFVHIIHQYLLELDIETSGSARSPRRLTP